MDLEVTMVNRINVRTADGVFAGYFDADAAAKWSDRDYNGNGSGGTGRGQAMFRTAGGKWVLSNWSAWQNEKNSYEFITAEDAKTWLLENDEDIAVEEYFGEQPDEVDLRAPGRPEIGGKYTMVYGDTRLAQIDAYMASVSAPSRADAIRTLIDRALQLVDEEEDEDNLVTHPYAVTIREISTGDRETCSRHKSMAEAVAAYRKYKAWDNEDNGLLSCRPRIERDGQVVDPDTYQ